MTRILRYSFPERLMHALSAISYVYLLLTGLAFWTPAFYWIAVVLGGGYLSRVLHPWIGLVFTIAVCWMVVTWREDMRTTAGDRSGGRRWVITCATRMRWCLPPGGSTSGRSSSSG